ncbi:hypothetical protein [Massilia sp. TSP1-1-2]|uniref:hypothetical protein n=1 Tax=Massilia sp. TSP1-1-2 TaxID=2804649 RepID=UPI003CEF09AD
MDRLPAPIVIAMALIGLMFAAIMLGSGWHYGRRRTWIKVQALVINTAFDSEDPKLLDLTVTYPVKAGSGPAVQRESTVSVDASMCEKAFGVADLRLHDQLLRMPLDVWYAREFPYDSYAVEQCASSRRKEAVAACCIGALILALTMLLLFSQL